MTISDEIYKGIMWIITANPAGTVFVLALACSILVLWYFRGKHERATVIPRTGGTSPFSSEFRNSSVPTCTGCRAEEWKG